MSEREKYEGKKAILEREKAQILLLAEGLVSKLRETLDITSVESINSDSLMSHALELSVKLTRLSEIKQKIDLINKEFGI